MQANQEVFKPQKEEVKLTSYEEAMNLFEQKSKQEPAKKQLQQFNNYNDFANDYGEEDQYYDETGGQDMGQMFPGMDQMMDPQALMNMDPNML